MIRPLALRTEEDVFDICGYFDSWHGRIVHQERTRDADYANAVAECGDVMVYGGKIKFSVQVMLEEALYPMKCGASFKRQIDAALVDGNPKHEKEEV